MLRLHRNEWENFKTCNENEVGKFFCCFNFSDLLQVNQEHWDDLYFKKPQKKMIYLWKEFYRNPMGSSEEIAQRSGGWRGSEPETD